MSKVLLLLSIYILKINCQNVQILYPINTKDLSIQNESLIISFDIEYDFLVILNDQDRVPDLIGFTNKMSSEQNSCLVFFLISNVKTDTSYGENSHHLINVNLKNILNSKSKSKSTKLYICAKYSNTDKTWEHQGENLYVIVKPKSFSLPLYASLLLAFFLLILSGLFSGLNIGLMSVDVHELEVIVATGSPQQRLYAQNIIPLRKLGNILLVCILLSNTAVNSTLTIIIDKMSSGTIAIVVSTICIMIFGEIIPQSICSRYALFIGSCTRYIMWFVIFITGVVSFPIGYLINYILGPEPLAVIGRQQLLALIRLHGKNVNLDHDEVGIISGALNFRSKAVAEAMVTIENCFLLSEDAILDFDTIAKIVQSGFSRIPVYSKSKSNVVGLLLLKDLTLVDPDDNVPLISVVNFYKRPIIKVFSDITLDKLFSEFKNGIGHLAVVLSVKSDNEGDPYYETIGIITLEDIIEEIIQAEITDETDFFNPKTQPEAIKKLLPFFHQESYKLPQLSQNMILTAFQFLSTAVPAFSDQHIKGNTLQHLITRTEVVCKFDSLPDEPCYLYQKNVMSDTFTLILEGKVEVFSGQENIQSIHGPFTYFGLSSLNYDYSDTTLSSKNITPPPASFIPDFSVKVVDTLVCLRIKNSLYFKSLQINEKNSELKTSFSQHTESVPE